MRAIQRAASAVAAIVAGCIIFANGSDILGSLQAEAQNAAPNSAPTMVLTKDKAQAILGKPVTNAQGENMGRIVDVIVDKAGVTRAAIIDFGGFLGVGSRQIAVDWAALQFTPAGTAEHITLGLTRDQLKSAPEYQKGKPVVVLGASGNTQPLAAGEYPLDH